MTHYVYRLYDKKKTLLYVGETSNVSNRMSQHAMDKPWWVQVARYEVESFDTKPQAHHAESVAIRTENPLYNRAGRPKGSPFLEQRPSAGVYLTIAEGAEMLGVSTKTIRRYIAAGRLTGLRLGPSMIRLDLSELHGLLRVIPSAVSS